MSTTTKNKIASFPQGCKALYRHGRGWGFVKIIEFREPLCIVQDTQTGEQYPAAMKSLKSWFQLSHKQFDALGLISPA